MISVVMPAHNEQDYLEAAVGMVLERLRGGEPPFEVLVAENGSTDGTAAVAQRLAAANPEVLLLQAPAADYGQALRAGFMASRGDVVVNCDVDSVDVGFFDRALAALGKEEVVLVVGSKRSPGALDLRNRGRKAVTAVFSAILRGAFGLNVSDTHGHKAMRRAELSPLVDACRFSGDIFDTELILRAERAGLGVIEIPVTVTDQRPPRTPIARRIPRSVVGLARLRLALWQEGRPAKG